MGIARIRRVRIDTLTPLAKRQLVAQLYGVYSESCTGMSSTRFEEEWFTREGARAALYYAKDGTLLGHVCAQVTTVKHGGRRHAVFSAGVFFRPGCRGGTRAAQFGVSEALRVKASQPHVPLAYLTRANSPATYRLLAQNIGCVYPNRFEPMPESLTDLVRATLAARKSAAGVDPWLSPSTAMPRDSERLRASRSLAEDPDARFYRQLNPHYAAGTSLFVWIPLDVKNIASAVKRLTVGR